MNDFGMAEGRLMNEEWQKDCSGTGKFFVRISDKKARKDLIMFLEKNGFACAENESRSRESTIESRFPLTVDLGRKEYGHIGNTTCAAAAAASGKLITVKEFMSLYEIVNPVVIV